MDRHYMGSFSRSQVFEKKNLLDKLLHPSSRCLAFRLRSKFLFQNVWALRLLLFSTCIYWHHLFPPPADFQLADRRLHFAPLDCPLSQLPCVGRILARRHWNFRHHSLDDGTHVKFFVNPLTLFLWILPLLVVPAWLPFKTTVFGLTSRPHPWRSLSYRPGAVRGLFKRLHDIRHLATTVWAGMGPMLLCSLSEKIKQVWNQNRILQIKAYPWCPACERWGSFGKRTG